MSGKPIADYQREKVEKWVADETEYVIRAEEKLICTVKTSEEEFIGVVRPEPKAEFFVSMDSIKYIDPQDLVKILLPQPRESRCATQG